MPETRAAGDRIRLFGNFDLDPARGSLLCAGQPIHLRPQSYAVLEYLVENRGHLVTKDRLIEHVWEGRAVTDGSLGKCIEEVREALGENARQYVKNVHGRGYLLEAEVEASEAASLASELAANVDIAVPVPDDSVSSSQGPVAHAELTPWGRKRVRGAVAGLLLVLAVAAAYSVLRSTPRPRAADGRVTSMAVLPFKSLAPDNRDEVLEMGMAETLMTRLSGLGEIAVRPGASVSKYSDEARDPLAAGRELGVDAVLDGSIQRDGDRVRVVVRLLSVADGKQMWAARFDEEFGDIFSVQDSISERVANELAERLTEDERRSLTRRHTENAESYQLYLKGRYHWNKRSPDGLEKAMEHFRDAIDLDPGFAPAYAGLADSYILTSLYGARPPKDAMPKAKAAASRALEIDGSFAEAHVSSALVDFLYDYDLTRAERGMLRAVELRPNYATGHHWYGNILAMDGRYEQALKTLQRAQDLDPLSQSIATDMAFVHYLSGRTEEAVERLKKTLDLDQSYVMAHYHLALNYARQKRHHEAIHEFETVKNLTSGRQGTTELAWVYALLGRRVEALALLHERPPAIGDAYVSPVMAAATYAALGDRDRAFQFLGEAYHMRDGFLVSLKVDPVFDPLRDDPRFSELLRRVGLATS